MSCVTFGFGSIITVFAVVWWELCDMMGAPFQHTGGLTVESRLLTLALPSTSTSTSSVHDAILLIWSAGVNRKRVFSFVLGEFPCHLSIDAASLTMIVTINKSVTGADTQVVDTLAPVSSFLVAVFIQHKYAICLAFTAL